MASWRVPVSKRAGHVPSPPGNVKMAPTSWPYTVSFVCPVPLRCSSPPYWSCSPTLRGIRPPLTPPRVFRASLLVVPPDPAWHQTRPLPLSQVFRASLLVVPDLRVASDPAFSAISVTAEQWVPMAEVTEGALLPWLERKQAQG